MTERWRAEAEQTMREIDKVRNLDEYDGSVKREVLDIILELIERVEQETLREVNRRRVDG